MKFQEEGEKKKKKKKEVEVLLNESPFCLNIKCPELNGTNYEMRYCGAKTTLSISIKQNKANLNRYRLYSLQQTTVLQRHLTYTVLFCMCVGYT
jgi:hypothetical protein